MERKGLGTQKQKDSTGSTFVVMEQFYTFFFYFYHVIKDKHHLQSCTIYKDMQIIVKIEF